MKDKLCNSTTIYNVIISFTNEKIIIITFNMIFKPYLWYMYNINNITINDRIKNDNYEL